MNTSRFMVIILIMSITLFSGCSDDEGGDVDTTVDTLTADFSFTNEESTFTFTNLSQDEATSFRWDFGDLGFISNEENPTHEYTIGGELTVSLTIMDGQGNTGYVAKTIQAPEIIVIDIAIDGELDDWEHVDVLAENTSGSGAIQIMKVWTVGENLNFYLEGSSEMELDLVQIYMNTDGNSETGYLSGDWSESAGAEVMFEGPFVNDSWGNFFQQGEGSGWAFNDYLEGSSVADLNISEILSLENGNNAVEFSIKKSILPNLGDEMSLGILELNSGWSTVSVFPANGSFVHIEL